MQYKTLKYLFYSDHFEMIKKIYNHIISMNIQEYNPDLENVGLLTEFKEYNSDKLID